MQSVTGAITELDTDQPGPGLLHGGQSFIATFVVETSDGRRLGAQGCVTDPQRDCLEHLMRTRSPVTIEFISNHALKLVPPLNTCHLPAFTSTFRESIVPEMVGSN